MGEGGAGMKLLIGMGAIMACYMGIYGMEKRHQTGGLDISSSFSDDLQLCAEAKKIVIPPHVDDAQVQRIVSTYNEPCCLALSGRCSLRNLAIESPFLVNLKLYQTYNLISVTLKTPELRVLDLAYCPELTCVCIDPSNCIETIYVPACTKLSVDCIAAMIDSCRCLKVLDVRLIGLTEEAIALLRAINAEVDILYKNDTRSM